MNPPHSQDPNPPLYAQLGEFSKLPPELRFQIWNNLFDGIFDYIEETSHPLAILYCSRFLNEETSHLLYQHRHLSLHLDIGHMQSYDELGYVIARGLIFFAEVRLNECPVRIMNLSCLEDALKLLRNVPYWRFRKPGPCITINTFGGDDPDGILELSGVVVRISDTLNARPHRGPLVFEPYSPIQAERRKTMDWVMTERSHERFPGEYTPYPLSTMAQRQSWAIHAPPDVLPYDIGNNS